MIMFHLESPSQEVFWEADRDKLEFDGVSFKHDRQREKREKSKEYS